MKKTFDIYDYVHNSKITLNVDGQPNATHVSKGYNDIRKTTLKEAKIVDGKFSIAESLKEEPDNRPLSNEVKRHFLEIISTYNTFQDQMKRPSDLTEVSETLGGIVEAAKELATREAPDWFDGVTVKRNMQELQKLDEQFEKFASEAKLMDERLHALYEDMGHILNRYYNIADIAPEEMKERLAIKESIIPKVGSKIKVYDYQDGTVNAIVDKILDKYSILVRTKSGKYRAEITNGGRWEIPEEESPIKESREVPIEKIKVGQKVIYRNDANAVPFVVKTIEKSHSDGKEYIILKGDRGNEVLKRITGNPVLLLSETVQQPKVQSSNSKLKQAIFGK